MLPLLHQYSPPTPISLYLVTLGTSGSCYNPEMHTPHPHPSEKWGVWIARRGDSMATGLLGAATVKLVTSELQGGSRGYKTGEGTEKLTLKPSGLSTQQIKI